MSEMPSASRHYAGISAGTGGSEEWPSTQMVPEVQRKGRSRNGDRERDRGGERTEQDVREHADDEKVSRRKEKRQPPCLGMAPPPTRRSPDLPDSWQEPMQQAWNGQQQQLDFHGGLPSIHGSYMGAPQAAGFNDGSRAPSRVSVGAPTPREEDSLDVATRQLHGSSRLWSGAGANDWPGKGPGPADMGPRSVGPLDLQRERGAPLGEPRTPQHSQHDSRSGFSGLRRPDLSAHYGH